MPVSEFNVDYHWEDSSLPASFSWNQPTILAVTKELHPRRVIDIGCGNGALAGSLASQGLDVVGCDYDETGVKIATQRYPDARFLRLSTYDAPEALGPLNFDVAISAEVIEHCFKPRELLKFARRCLKPKGHLIISTPYHGYLKNLALSVFGMWDQHHMVWEDGGHIKFFSPQTLEAMLEAEGFVVRQKHFVGRVSYLWKGMIFVCELNPESISGMKCKKCGDPVAYPTNMASMLARRKHLCARCFSPQ